MKRTHIAATIMILFVSGSIQAEDKKVAPEKVLFANEKWYQNQKGKEQAFIGKVIKIERVGGGIGFGRHNLFHLVMEKETREIYLGGRFKLLDPYLNKRVRIVGKVVDMEVEGSEHHEIWPGQIAFLKEEEKEKQVGKAKEKVLFTKEKWYLKEKDKEQAFTGKLIKVAPRCGHYPFRLIIKKKPVKFLSVIITNYYNPT